MKKKFAVIATIIALVQPFANEGVIEKTVI